MGGIGVVVASFQLHAGDGQRLSNGSLGYGVGTPESQKPGVLSPPENRCDIFHPQQRQTHEVSSQ